MGEASKIEWTEHTFNGWWGCFKVSPACKNCYAEAFAKRVGQDVWGPPETTARRFFGEKHWNEPRRWAKAAAAAGERHRVFCSSMADVFEEHPALDAEREKLWKLIRETAYVTHHGKPCTIGAHIGHDAHCRFGLDWLLLTKRPENVNRMIPSDVLPLVWIGTTVEDQENADKRIPELLEVIAARVRFLSCEPLLEPVDLSKYFPLPLQPGYVWGECLCAEIDPADVPCVVCEARTGVDWVIVGGESGPKSRPFDLGWARSIVAQCNTAQVPVFVKQLGRVPVVSEESWRTGPEKGRMLRALNKDKAPEGTVPIAFADTEKAGAIEEWPADLQVRQAPRETR